MKIMAVTSVMVVLMIVWCGLTLWRRGATLPPFELRFNDEALGWLAGTGWERKIGALGILIAFGHSILAMSGEETLAQVNREIAHPKVPNLLKAGFVIFVYSMLMTTLISFFAVMIIPDDVRMATYSDDLIGGLAMSVVGPLSTRIALRAFVVIVGFLILAGALNTAIVGSNGVLDRVAEDGVLADWFRRPHPRYGTTSRILNLVVGLQIITIAASRGNVYALGEAYAFGVVWSFVFMALSVAVLRFKDRRPRAWSVPFNIPVGRGSRLPLGIGAVFLVLLATAAVNLVTKRVATESGIAFTILFFALFTVSERLLHHGRGTERHLEEFNLHYTSELDRTRLGLGARPVKVVAVHDPKRLSHLDRALKEAEQDEADVVVVSVRVARRLGAVRSKPPFMPAEQATFSAVVELAEAHGKTVVPLVVFAPDVFLALARTAHELGAAEVVMGRSGKVDPEAQAESFAHRWRALEPHGRREIVFRVASGRDDFRFAA